MDSTYKTLAILTLAFFLYSCGGGGGNNQLIQGDFTLVEEFEVSPGGIWYEIPEPFIFASTDSSFSSLNDDSIIGVIAPSIEDSFLAQLQNSTTFFISETGEIFIQHYHDADLSFSIGQGQVTSSDGDGIGGGYEVQTFRIDPEDLNTGFAPAVPVSGVCQLDGTLVAGNALFLSSTCEYEDDTAETFNFNLIAAEDCSTGFCSVSSIAYENPLSLSEIAGSYEIAFFGLILSNNVPIERLEISPSGIISGSNGLSAGCEINGQISFIDEAFNLYEISWTLSECDITQADGAEISGLAAARVFEDNLFLETIVQIESDEENGPNTIAVKRNFLRLAD